MQKKSLAERDKAVVWHPFTPLLTEVENLPVVRAEGVYLQTEDGRKILDAVSSWWVNIHGHGNEYIANAAAKQARELEHVIFAGFTHEPAVRIAERVIKILPGNQQKVFFSDNGSTAVEVGLKMAIQYWYNKGIQKRRIIAFEGAYHGDTFGAMSVGDRSAFVKPFAPYLFEVDFLPFPGKDREEDVKILFRKLAESDEIAAFIFEPLVQGSAGMRMYSAALLDELLGIAKEFGIICIADEVMTGFGRTGKLFASSHLTHTPDIFCLSKGLTGGTLPLGLTTCTDQIQEAYRETDIMKTFFHGHSYTANPIACAVANASMDLLLTDECNENIGRVSYQQGVFAERLSDHPKVKDARSCGTIIAIELKTEEGTSYFNKNRNYIYQYFLNKNILLRPLGNVIYILPPYIITNKELDLVYGAIEEFLSK